MGTVKMNASEVPRERKKLAHIVCEGKFSFTP